MSNLMQDGGCDGEPSGGPAIICTLEGGAEAMGERISVVETAGGGA
jgi:hypothetical protein